MTLDDRGIHALGKVSEPRKLAELARADVLCAPSLGGESFGMVITEGFAAGTPVLASDIPGYRDVLRDGIDGQLVPAGDPLALAQALRQLALEPRAPRAYGRRRARARRALCLAARGRRSARLLRAGPRRRRARHAPGPRRCASRIRARRPAAAPSPPGGCRPSNGRRAGGAPHAAPAAAAPRCAGSAWPLSSLLGAGLAALALAHIGVARVAASLLASKPGLLAAGLAVMCAAMFVRALAWHAILAVAPTWRRAKRRDAMQGTFIGVLMSCTLPARLGEPSRALIVARRLGRARETLPVVLGTMVSQTLLNLLALTILGCVTLSSVSVLDGHDRALLLIALAPLAVLVAVLLAPIVIPAPAASRSRRLQALLAGLRGVLLRLRDGLRVFRRPRPAAIATVAQLGAWALQWMSCWLLLMALGLDSHAGVAAAAGVLFAVNVTAAIPATPANIGVFQAACVAVLAGAYHVSTADAIAYGIVLQAVEISTALLMGVPALLGEGLSWRDVRLRTMHAAPVTLPALPERRLGATGRAPSP